MAIVPNSRVPGWVNQPARAGKVSIGTSSQREGTCRHDGMRLEAPGGTTKHKTPLNVRRGPTKHVEGVVVVVLLRFQNGQVGWCEVKLAEDDRPEPGQDIGYPGRDAQV